MEDTLNWNDLNTETIAFTNEININNIKKILKFHFLIVYQHNLKKFLNLQLII